MSKRFTSGIVAVITTAAMAIPAVGLADRGGHPHSSKPCKTHRHYGKHRGASKGRKRGSDKGKKCGWNRTGQTGPTGSTGQTGTTGAMASTIHRSTHSNH